MVARDLPSLDAILFKALRAFRRTVSEDWTRSGLEARGQNKPEFFFLFETPRHEENTKTCIFLQFWTPGGAKTQENLVFYKATRENKQSHSRKQQATRENKQPTRENKDPAGHRDHNPAPPGRPATPGPRPKHSKTLGFRENDPKRRLQFNLVFCTESMHT